MIWGLLFQNNFPTKMFSTQRNVGKKISVEAHDRSHTHWGGSTCSPHSRGWEKTPHNCHGAIGHDHHIENFPFKRAKERKTGENHFKGISPHSYTREQGRQRKTPQQKQIENCTQRKRKSQNIFESKKINIAPHFLWMNFKFSQKKFSLYISSTLKKEQSTAREFRIRRTFWNEFSLG